MFEQNLLSVTAVICTAVAPVIPADASAVADSPLSGRTHEVLSEQWQNLQETHHGQN